MLKRLFSPDIKIQKNISQAGFAGEDQARQGIHQAVMLFI
jgi:hypothetical protein